MTKIQERDVIEDHDLPLEEFPEGDGVLVMSPEGRIMANNLQAERILKIRLHPGEVYKLGAAIKPQYLSQAREAVEDALESGHTTSNLVAAVRLNEGLPVSVTYSTAPLYGGHNKIIGVILTFREMEVKPAPSQLFDKFGEAEFEKLFENLAEGVFTIDRRWRITSFNKQAQLITGYRAEEVIGKTCWNIFKSESCHGSCPLKTTLETGIIRMDQDVRITGKHGRPLSVLVNTSVLKNKNEEVLGAIETFRPLIKSKKTDRLKPSEKQSGNEIIGKSSALLSILNMLPDVAASEASVLLEGDSGTGKELIAQTIHNLSPRANGPFVAVNCSALSETLLESELFGHEKGAFTGAISSKVGRFELARGGTLFLDEIGDIKPEIQVKLLRVLEERMFERVGGIRSIVMDARLITATNRDMVKEMRDGRFREDLFYRLRTVPLRLPPLTERPEDIPALVAHFISKFNAFYKKKVRGMDPKAMTQLKRYHWPGNIRELQNLIEHAFVFVKGPIIALSHLPSLEEPDETSNRMSHRHDHMEDELLAIIKALEMVQGRKTEAARKLGISRSTLWRKMKNYGLIEK